MSGGSVNRGRRRFLIGSTSLVGAAGGVAAAVPFVQSWTPSARALAAGAPVTVDIGRLQVGQLLGPIPAWRGQPIFIYRRAEETLENLESNTEHLADPESENTDQQPPYAQNFHRSIRPDVSVLVGLCTHLGCSPLFNPEVEPQQYDEDWTGGFYCPCHGSMFDLAGRVYRSVPAPDNLEVPPYHFESDNVVVVGVDPENS